MASFYYYDQNPSAFCFLLQIRTRGNVLFYLLNFVLIFFFWQQKLAAKMTENATQNPMQSVSSMLADD